jgi:anaerobic magnesium-protoporphyrin IX monomethyl ester cyclase
MRTLDDLPLPAWDLVDVDAYKKVWQRSGLPFQLNVATTRGCPYKCNWCAKPIYGQRYNVRSPQKVVQELQYLKAHYGVTNLWMCDDIFGLKPGWVQSFNEGLKEAGLTVTYKIQSRADLLLKENNLEALVQSGLIEAWIGAESGSQKILDAMDKGTTVDQIYTATELLQKNGVKVGHFLQFGYLGETEKDIQATFTMLQKAKPDLIGVSVSYPLPGTPFYEKVKDQLGQKANWTDSDDLALMFKNTYNQRYYKILHSLVHKSFTFQKVLNQFKQSYFKGATIKQTLQLLFFPPLIWGYKLLLSTQNNTH